MMEVEATENIGLIRNSSAWEERQVLNSIEARDRGGGVEREVRQ